MSKKEDNKLYVCNRVNTCSAKDMGACRKHSEAHKKVYVDFEEQMCTQWGPCATINKRVRCTTAHNAVIKD